MVYDQLFFRKGNGLTKKKKGGKKEDRIATLSRQYADGGKRRKKIAVPRKEREERDIRSLPRGWGGGGGGGCGGGASHNEKDSL